MLSKKDNFLETVRGGKPDRFVKQYEGCTMVPGDPVNFYVRGDRHPGMAPKRDRFGTLILWPEGEPGAVPDPNDKIIHDVETWKDVLKIPDLIAGADIEEDWAPYLERCAQVDREETLLMTFAPTGIFERMHFIMGFEDTLMNFLLEPELMADLAMALGEYRYNGYKLMVKYAHPDAILSHDDFGSKTQLFVPPDSWREILKPAYRKGYDFLHDNGVVIIHHSDSYCDSIIEDLVDLHIDVWQGVLPQNDIPKLQKQLAGRMTLMGGIDAAIVDREDSTEEEIRTEVRRACDEYAAGGHFIPCITYGALGTIYPQADKFIDDEIDRFNHEHYGTPYEPKE